MVVCSLAHAADRRGVRVERQSPDRASHPNRFRACPLLRSFVCLFVCLLICLFVCLFARLFLSHARLRQGYSGVLTGYSGSTQEVCSGFVVAGAAADRRLDCGRGAAAGGGGVGWRKVLLSTAEFFRVLLSTVDLGNGLRPFLLLAVRA